VLVTGTQKEADDVHETKFWADFRRISSSSSQKILDDWAEEAPIE
jgi:hypothetical protein